MFRTVASAVLIAAATGAASQGCVQDFDYVSPRGHEQGDANRATLQKGLKAAGAGDFETFMSVAADPYIQHSPDLPDGWKPVWDLTTNREANFSSKLMEWMGPKSFLDNGPYLVMFREVDHGDGPHKKFDLMYFDEEGLYAEHWDMAQAMRDETASGRRETAAAVEFTDAPVTYDEATEAANGRMIAAYLNLLSNAGQAELAFTLYTHPDVAQHNPDIADGRQALIDYFAQPGMASLCRDIRFILTQNDLVWTYSSVQGPQGLLAAVDMFRVRDGMIVEHWDLFQAVPDDMPHDNGMF